MPINEALRKTFEWPSVRRSIAVAIVVGSALNLINQGPEMLNGHWPVMWKLAMTYVVVVFSILVQGLTMRRVLAYYGVRGELPGDNRAAASAV